MKGPGGNDIANLEARMKDNLSDARSSLRNLYGASQGNSKGLSVETDSTLHNYLKVKSDTRALLTYYRDIAAYVPSKSSITIVNSTVHSKDKHSQSSSGMASDDILVKFEQTFDIRDDGSSNPEHNQAQNESFLLKQIAALHAAKDNALYKLINFSLEQLGIEHIVSERKNLPPNLEACSKKLPMILHFLKTFKSLGKKAKIAALMQTSQGAAHEISMQQIQIETLQNEMQARMAEIFGMRKRIDVLSQQTERQHIIVQQQDRIASLERELEEAGKEARRVFEDFRREVQQKSFMKDQLVVVQTKLEQVKATYEKDVQRLKPLLEEYVHRSQEHVKEMNALKNDSTLNLARQQQAEKRKLEAEKELHASQAKIKVLGGQLAESLQTTKALAEDNARQERLKRVITAAKVRFQEMAAASDLHASEAEEGRKEMHGHCIAYATAVSNLQEYSRELEEALKISEDENTDLRAQLKMFNADVRSRDLQSSIMQKDLTRLQASQSSAIHGGEALDKIKSELTSARAELERKEKQLQTAMHRIYELQGLLLDYQQGVAEGDELLTSEDPDSGYY